jgi:hypothetical protein
MNEVVRRLREPDGKVQVWVYGDSMETKPRPDGEPGVLMFAKDDTRALGAIGVREQGVPGTPRGDDDSDRRAGCGYHFALNPDPPPTPGRYEVEAREQAG